jgi:hypothetical protein
LQRQQLFLQMLILLRHPVRINTVGKRGRKKTATGAALGGSDEADYTESAKTDYEGGAPEGWLGPGDFRSESRSEKT